MISAGTPAALASSAVPVACGFEAPDLTENETIRCFTISVPPRVDGSSMKDLALFATVVGKNNPGNADPVMHLPGGPGASAEAYAPILASTYLPLAVELDRQIIFVDQRGSGRSTPFLGCDDPTKGADCAKKWQLEGIDTHAFTTALAADDIADVAAAFGVTTVNLWGPSYGSRLALETVRRHPDIVRSLTIESVDSADTPLDKVAGVRSALGRISDRCRADRECSVLTADVAADDDRVTVQLATRPLMTQYGSMDAAVFAETTQRLMEASTGRSMVPLFVGAVSRGDVATVDAVLLVLSAEPVPGGKFSVGMQMLTNCSDIALFAPSERLTANEPPREALFDRSTWASMSTLTDEACLPWNAAPAPSTGLVTSDVPALILAGSDDSNTPLENAKRVASKLSSSTLVELPGYGHFPLHRGGNVCSAKIYAAFVRDPSGSVDTSCVNEAPAYGLLPSLKDVRLTTTTLNEVGISVAGPTDWLPAGAGTFVGAGSSVTVTLSPGDPKAVLAAVGQALGVPAPSSRATTVGDATWDRASIPATTPSGEVNVEIALVAAGDQTLSVSVASPKSQARLAGVRLTEILESIKPL